MSASSHPRLRILLCLSTAAHRPVEESLLDLGSTVATLTVYSGLIDVLYGQQPAYA